MEVTASSWVGARSSDIQGRVYNNARGGCPPPSHGRHPRAAQKPWCIRPPPRGGLPVPGREPGAPRPEAATAHGAVRGLHPPHLLWLGVGAVDVPPTAAGDPLAASGGGGGLA